MVERRWKKLEGQKCAILSLNLLVDPLVILTDGFDKKWTSRTATRVPNKSKARTRQSRYGQQ